MRIDAFNQISQLYGVNKKTSVASSNKTSSTDQVEISSFGKELQVAKQAVISSPDVRADKVEYVKSQLASGAYNMDSAAVADKLLEKLDGEVF